MSYKSFADDNDVRTSEALALESEAADLRYKSRVARCCNFVFCRYNSSAMLVAVDLVVFGVDIWSFASLIRAAVTQSSSIPWWIYTVQVIPLALQLLLVLGRIRYVYSGASEANNANWHLRHISSPFVATIIGLVSVAAFLFSAPLCTSTSLPPGEQSFVALWQLVGTMPSSIAFLIAFAVSAFCNWRVSSKHRWRIKCYIIALQGQSLAMKERSNATQTMAHDIITSSRMGTIRDQAPSAPTTLRSFTAKSFVPEANYDIPKSPRKNNTKKKKSSHLKTSNSAARSNSALDFSRHSDED